MHKIPVYSVEVSDGVAEAVQASASVAYLSRLDVVEPDERLLARVRASAQAAGRRAEVDEDLFFTRDILASCGWNLNADVFLPEELLAAAGTILHKPFNLEHEYTKIIGHVVDYQVVDDGLSPLADDLPIDALPASFHVANSSYLYRRIGDESHDAFMEAAEAEIREGRWCTSMEAFFRGFDYAMKGPGGEARLIRRDQSTAFLTKHLVQYGGKGSYRDPSTGVEFSIGRALRRIHFKGKGLVRTPANPNSKFISASVHKFNGSYVDLGYSTVSSVPDQENEMSDTNDGKAKDELIASLTKQIEELSKRGFEETIAKLQGDVAARDEKVTSLETQLVVIKEAQASLTARAESAEASLKAASEELATLKASRATAARLAKLAARDCPEASRETLVARLSVLSDADFDATVETLAPSWAKPAVTQADAEIAAIEEAKPEAEAALVVPPPAEESSVAKAAEYFASSVLQSTRNK